MERIAQFEKISYAQWEKDFRPLYEEIMRNMNGVKPEEPFEYQENDFQALSQAIYDDIKIPERATKGSAGNDMFFPLGTTSIPMGYSALIPTGLKCKMNEGWVMQIYPRSSLGFNFRLQMDNTVCIIDSDYYNNPSNEGHIFIRMTNDSKDGSVCTLEHNMAYTQAIFIPYGITYNDNVTAERVGGIGSTTPVEQKDVE